MDKISAMKKKSEQYNPIKARQIELLKKYYEVDETKKTVKITLAYEKASELFVNDYFSEEHPEFNGDILARVGDIISRVPVDYRVDLNFAIDDYEGYDPKTLIASFNDAVEMGHYSVLSESKKNGLRIALLLVAGISCLVFMIAGGHNGWFGSDSLKDLLTEVIDIVGWVFIWEAVSIMFLSPSEEKKRTMRLRNCVSSISFIDGESNECLAAEKCEDVFKQWAEESKVKRLSKELLLISGSGFLAISVSSLLSSISDILKPEYQVSPAFIIIYAITMTLSFLFLLIAGIGAISSYLGYGPFRRFVGFFAIANLVFASFTIGFSFIDTGSGESWKLLLSGIFSFIFFILYSLGWALSFKKE